jgi:ribosomal protein S17E
MFSDLPNDKKEFVAMLCSEFFCIVKEFLEETMKKQTKEEILVAAGYITHQAIILVQDRIRERDEDWKYIIRQQNGENSH